MHKLMRVVRTLSVLAALVWTVHCSKVRMSGDKGKRSRIPPAVRTGAIATMLAGSRLRTEGFNVPPKEFGGPNNVAGFSKVPSAPARLDKLGASSDPNE